MYFKEKNNLFKILMKKHILILFYDVAKPKPS